MYGVLYCALFLWIGVLTGIVFLGGIFGLAFALLFGAVYLYAGRRSTQQDALLWALAVTAERGMPLDPTLEAFAAQCAGKYRREVLAAADALKQGETLPQAIAHAPGLLPREAEPLVRTGHESGTLSAALRESADLRSRLRGPWMSLAIRLAYLTWVLLVLQSVAGFLAFFILPKFEAIFADFGVPLPAITILMIEVTHFLIKYFYIVYLPLLLIQLAVVGAATAAVFGMLPWDLPLVGRLFDRRHAAVVLRCLAQVVEGNRPIGQGLRWLVEMYPVERMRLRLLDAAREVEAGHDWCAALHAHSVIRGPELALLDAARRCGNLAWALRQAAETSERRFAYRFQVLVYAVMPLFVVAIGALVFVMTVAYFTPLLVLVEKLAS
jgi:protein transport protein HofC